MHLLPKKPTYKVYITMELTMNNDLMNILMLFLFMILPLLLILTGAVIGFMNALFYILTIFWFGMGLVFYKALQIK